MNKIWQANNADLANLVVQSRKRNLAGGTRLFCDKFSVNLLARKSIEGEEINLAKVYTSHHGFYISYFVENALHLEGAIVAEDLVLDGLQAISSWWESKGFPRIDDTENLVEITQVEWANFVPESPNNKGYGVDKNANQLLINSMIENNVKYQRISAYVGEEDAVWQGNAVYDLRVSDELLKLISRETASKGQYQPVLIERTSWGGKPHFILIHGTQKSNGWKTLGKNVYRTAPVYQEIENKGRVDTYINTAQSNYDANTIIQIAPQALLEQIGPVTNDIPNSRLLRNSLLDMYPKFGM